MRYALGSLGCLVAANPYDIDLHGQSIRVVRSSSLMLMMDLISSTTSTASPFFNIIFQGSNTSTALQYSFNMPSHNRRPARTVTVWNCVSSAQQLGDVCLPVQC